MHSNYNTCIKPASNFATSVQNGKSTEVYSLRYNKVYKSEAGLKCHTNRCKERDKHLENYPSTLSDIVNMAIEYTWSQNAKIISFSTIYSIYNKIVFLA